MPSIQITIEEKTAHDAFLIMLRDLIDDCNLYHRLWLEDVYVPGRCHVKFIYLDISGSAVMLDYLVLRMRQYLFWVYKLETQWRQTEARDLRESEAFKIKEEE